ncbi:11885_t:CDS:2, partial [Acaulospora colombiana]
QSFLRARSSRGFATASAPLTLGIRREDPSRIWERRVPLTPQAVSSLIRDEGVRVLLQPCARRIFPTQEYLNVGAELSDTLEHANIVLGIKETPLDDLVTDSVNGRSRIQLMFSHTAKGQSYNMPLLARFKQSTARLIDYELMTDPQGKRVVAFGWYAGAAGVPEAFSALALDHLKLGLLPRPYHHRSLEDLRQSLRNIGKIISERGTPKETGPYIVALTGNGNVSQGALSLLNELPLKHIRAEDLPTLATSKGRYFDMTFTVCNPHSTPATPRNVIYLLHVKPWDYLRDIRGGPYDRETYYSHPEMFTSHFHEKIAPYVSLVINGTGWKPGFPRLMNNLQLAEAQKLAQEIGIARFRTIADISCDIQVI